jgi:hypothetical protein
MIFGRSGVFLLAAPPFPSPGSVGGFFVVLLFLFFRCSFSGHLRWWGVFLDVCFSSHALLMPDLLSDVVFFS